MDNKKLALRQNLKGFCEKALMIGVVLASATMAGCVTTNGKDPVAKFFNDAADAFAQGMKQGSTGQSNFNLFGGPLPKYRDTGMSQGVSEDLSTVAVGNARSDVKTSIELGQNGQLTNASPSVHRVAASVQWRCFGMFRYDKGAYLQQIAGGYSNVPLLATYSGQRRSDFVRNINQSVDSRNDTLNGRSPLQRFNGPRLYGTDEKSRQRYELEKKVRRMQDLFQVSSGVDVPANMVGLSPNSKEAGLQALDYMRAAVSAAGDSAAQEGECALAYLEDRFGDESDAQIEARYEAILEKGTKNVGSSPMNCPIAASLASRYLSSGRSKEAYAVLKKTLPSTTLRFASDDMRRFRFPIQDCNYVQWMHGMMKAHGLGTNQSFQAAGESFENCAAGLDVCALNLALLEISGKAQPRNAMQPVRLLQQVARSNDPRLRQKAEYLLQNHFTRSQRIAGYVPDAWLKFGAIVGPMIAACWQDEECRKKSRSYSPPTGKSVSDEWNENLCRSYGLAGEQNTWTDYNCF